MKETGMLQEAEVHATIPCSDFQRAKQFYAEKLGLQPSDEQPAGAFYRFAGGTRFLLFPSGGAASGTHTQMGFLVTDIEATVRELRDRGVVFEDYDFEGFDKATGIATFGMVRSAWFKDSEGNLLGVVQLA